MLHVLSKPFLRWFHLCKPQVSGSQLASLYEDHGMSHSQKMSKELLVDWLLGCHTAPFTARGKDFQAMMKYQLTNQQKGMRQTAWLGLTMLFVLSSWYSEFTCVHHAMPSYTAHAELCGSSEFQFAFLRTLSITLQYVAAMGSSTAPRY